MNSDQFGKLFEIIWSIFAIGIGLYSILFLEKSIKNNTDGFRNWYKKTGFPLFKWQADNYDTASQRVVTVLVGMVFIIIGILTLLKNI